MWINNVRLFVLITSFAIAGCKTIDRKMEEKLIEPNTQMLVSKEPFSCVWHGLIKKLSANSYMYIKGERVNCTRKDLSRVIHADGKSYTLYYLDRGTDIYSYELDYPINRLQGYSAVGRDERSYWQLKNDTLDYNFEENKQTVLNVEWYSSITPLWQTPKERVVLRSEKKQRLELIDFKLGVIASREICQIILGSTKNLVCWDAKAKKVLFLDPDSLKLIRRIQLRDYILPISFLPELNKVLVRKGSLGFSWKRGPYQKYTPYLLDLNGDLTEIAVSNESDVFELMSSVPVIENR